MCLIVVRGMTSAETMATLEARGIEYIPGAREHSDEDVREAPLSVRSFHKCLEHRVGSVFVKVDANLCPKLIWQIIELAPGRDRHQYCLRLFLDRQLCELYRIWNQFD
jgi:hypothetical protein